MTETVMTDARQRDGERRQPITERRILSRHERPENLAVVRAVREAIARGEEFVGADPDADPDEMSRGFDALERMLVDLIERVMTAIADPMTRRPRLTTITQLVLDLEAARSALRERRMVERLQAFASVQETLDRLRKIDDVGMLLERAPLAICEACGLERGVLSRVTGSIWTIENAYFDGNDAWAEEFVRLGQNEYSAQLTHLLLETEMIRRRAPALVHDAQHHALTNRPLVGHADVRSYVSAPLIPEGRVIGFIHGDYYYSGHDVDTFDRETLWAFAQGFGQVFERASLLERLRAQRTQVRKLLADADHVMTELAEGELRFHRSDTGDAGVAQSAAAMFSGPEPRLEALLTRRQLEILGMMASGATNLEIASELVITEGTVKTHVKHILRKLRAANRAEAVARYFRLSIGASALEH